MLRRSPLAISYEGLALRMSGHAPTWVQCEVMHILSNVSHTQHINTHTHLKDSVSPCSLPSAVWLNTTSRMTSIPRLWHSLTRIAVQHLAASSKGVPTPISPHDDLLMGGKR
eukprot:scaffold150931_cov21-Tisochrysis_lutea.AAC.2